jgi:hypothetical protein
MELPTSCITLSQHEKEFCGFLKIVKVPSGCSTNISRIISFLDLKVAPSVKSHDYLPFLTSASISQLILLSSQSYLAMCSFTRYMCMSDSMAYWRRLLEIKLTMRPRALSRTLSNFLLPPSALALDTILPLPPAVLDPGPRACHCLIPGIGAHHHFNPSLGACRRRPLPQALNTIALPPSTPPPSKCAITILFIRASHCQPLPQSAPPPSSSSGVTFTWFHILASPSCDFIFEHRLHAILYVNITFVQIGMWPLAFCD